MARYLSNRKGPNFSVIVASGRDVADRWHRQYGERFKDSSDKLANGKNPKEIYQSLAALGENATVAQVDAVLGNNSWTGFWCHSCNETRQKGVAFGGDSQTEICADCIEAAVKEMRKAKIDP